MVSDESASSVRLLFALIYGWKISIAMLQQMAWLSQGHKDDDTFQVEQTKKYRCEKNYTGQKKITPTPLVTNMRDEKINLTYCGFKIAPSYQTWIAISATYLDTKYVTPTLYFNCFCHFSFEKARFYCSMEIIRQTQDASKEYEKSRRSHRRFSNSFIYCSYLFSFIIHCIFYYSL